MSTTVAVADWIKRIADDERRRDTMRIREEEAVARKADLVRRNGRRLIDDLRATVTRDDEAIRSESRRRSSSAIRLIQSPATTLVLMTGSTIRDVYGT